MGWTTPCSRSRISDQALDRFPQAHGGSNVMTDVVEHPGVVGLARVTPAVPDPPVIDGLRFRRLLLPDDVAELTELENLCYAADRVPERLAPEELANWLRPTERRDPDRD